MRNGRRSVLVVAAAAVLLVFGGCGEKDGQEEGRTGDVAFARTHLPANAQAVVSLDLDYDGPQWRVLKRMYARAAQSGALRGILGAGAVPPTLDGALNLAAGFIGVSFTDDIKPVLGGRLVFGTAVDPAPELTSQTQQILERVDTGATRFDDRTGKEIFVDREGQAIRDIPAPAIQAALTEQREREPAVRTTLVYKTGDRKALDRLLGKLDELGVRRKALAGVKDAVLLTDGVALVGGDTLVASFEGTGSLRRTLAGPGADAAALSEGRGLLDARLQPRALAGLLDSGELTKVLATPAGRALRGATASLSLHDGLAVGDARVDFEGLPDSALPLPAAKPVDVPKNVGLGSGSVNQSLTTVFFARLTRALYPRSAFVKAVEELEAETKIPFETGVLQQFSGPSQSLLIPGPDGDASQFAARSSLRDAAAMRKLLPTIAPRLPDILNGLNGLGGTALAGLLLVAPDAPLVPAAAAILGAVQVKPLTGQGSGGQAAKPDDELLYSVSGVDATESVTGSSDVVYGVIGDVFVVASTRELARRVAKIPTQSTPAAGTRLRFDVERLLTEARVSPEDGRLVRSLVKGGDIEASAVRGDIVAHAEVRLGG